MAKFEVTISQIAWKEEVFVIPVNADSIDEAREKANTIHQKGYAISEDNTRPIIPLYNFLVMGKDNEGVDNVNIHVEEIE